MIFLLHIRISALIIYISNIQRMQKYSVLYVLIIKMMQHHL